MPVSSPPEQVMRHTASTRHDLTAKLVEQLLRRPQPRSDAEPTCGEATTWWRTQKAQARDRVPDPGLPWVELPGIEPAPEIAMTCGNAEHDYARRREITCGNAARVDGINRVRAISGIALTR